MTHLPYWLECPLLRGYAGIPAATPEQAARLRAMGLAYKAGRAVARPIRRYRLVLTPAGQAYCEAIDRAYPGLVAEVVRMAGYPKATASLEVQP